MTFSFKFLKNQSGSVWELMLLIQKVHFSLLLHHLLVSNALENNAENYSTKIEVIKIYETGKKSDHKTGDGKGVRTK